MSASVRDRAAWVCQSWLNGVCAALESWHGEPIQRCSNFTSGVRSTRRSLDLQAPVAVVWCQVVSVGDRLVLGSVGCNRTVSRQ
jgi:hypothetical protein